MWGEIFTKEIYSFQPINDNPIILDIGANIGLSSLYFSKKYETAIIYSYEPDPEIYSCLVHNINKNDLDNVKPYNIAVWKDDCTLSFNNAGGDEGSITTAKSDTSIDVQAISFRKLLTSIDQPIDLLKMDIEGAEIDTVLSYPEGLKKANNLFIEYHSFLNENQKLDTLLDAISTAGFRYKIFNVYDNMPESPFLNNNIYGNMDLQLNIFAQKIKQTI